MKTCIVRIYRQGKDSLSELVGVVEEPETEEKKRFENIKELNEIMKNFIWSGHYHQGNKTWVKKRRAPK